MVFTILGLLGAFIFYIPINADFEFQPNFWVVFGFCGFRMANFGCWGIGETLFGGLFI